MVDKQSKRAPGGSPALSFLLAGAKAVVVIVTVLVVLIGGWLAWWWYRPDLLFDPISRHVHTGFLECRDGGRCPADVAGWKSMVPEIFAIGEPRDQVVKRLRAAGFDGWVTDQPEEHYAQSGAAMSPFPCSSYYNVRVTFDASKRLVTAESTFNGTPSCL
ncbi:hypothetical protein [Devosia sp. Root105]|uniref:hypothetical protein n=1 Tax=Devosia sp. Root105 TaxID=1736423 RepID=UPI0006F96DFB|nr:hypothetical protein [Devosia sp. Root105]